MAVYSKYTSGQHVGYNEVRKIVDVAVSERRDDGMMWGGKDFRGFEITRVWPICCGSFSAVCFAVEQRKNEGTPEV